MLISAITHSIHRSLPITLLAQLNGRKETAPTPTIEYRTLHIHIPRIRPQLQQDESPGNRWVELEADSGLTPLDMKAGEGDVGIFEGAFFCARGGGMVGSDGGGAAGSSRSGMWEGCRWGRWALESGSRAPVDG